MPPDAASAPRRVPAGHGFAWLAQSLSLLRLQAGRLLLIGVLMQLILGLSQVPVIQLLIVISVPGLTAGLLEAFHVAARGGQPDIRLLFKPLTSGTHSGRLFAMGILVFAVGVICMSLLLSGNEEALSPALMERLEQRDVSAVDLLDQGLLGRMLLAVGVGVAVSGTLSYFAIPLIWFGNCKLGSALAVGLRGLFVNWRPFLLLGCGLVLLLLGLAGAIAVLLSLSGTGGVLGVLTFGFVMLLLMLFQLMLFGTQYCAYRDIFGIADPPTTPLADDGQLLA